MLLLYRELSVVREADVLSCAGPAPRLRLQGTILHSNKGGLRPPAPSSAMGSDAPSTPAPTTAPPSAATSLGGGGSITSGSGSAGGGGGGGNSVPVSDFNVGLFLGQDDKPDRSPKKIFVTGATGSIGRCVVTQLLQDTQHTGTPFACFTSTKVQTLTSRRHSGVPRAQPVSPAASHHCARASTHPTRPAHRQY